MLFDKIKVMAQVIGFICIGLLAIYGGVVAATGGPPAWAAGAAAPAAPEAITPALISYQGTLRDAGDNPANGTYNMVVKIYDNAGGTGTALWSETHNSVQVREGHFNLLLGDQGSPIPSNIFTEPDRYIQLTVGGVIMNPTQRFAAVPYAIAATYATTLSAPDGDPAEAVTVGNTGNVHIGASDRSTVVTMQGITPTLRLDHGAGNVEWGIRANGEDFEIQETDWSGYPARLKIRGGDGYVGIGTTDPQNKLDVNGDASVSGNLGVGTTSPDQKLSVIGTVRGANDAEENAYTEIAHGGSNGYINTVGDGDLDFRHDGNTKMSLSDAGDLDVVGNIAWSGHLQNLSRTGSYDAISDHAGDVYTQMVAKTSNSLCYLGSVKFRELDTAGESGVCDVAYSGGYWRLHAYATGDSYAECRAWCLEW